MPLTVTPDPNLKALLQTVRLMDADERIDSSWFQDPIGGLRTILSDPVQRAALRVLLDQVLGSDEGSPEGTEWHPLLDGEAKGNVFVTVTGDVIGLAASIATPSGISPATRGSVRVPLVDAGGDDLRAIAATPDGPLEITLELDFDSTAPVDALRVAATVDIEGGAAVRFELDGVDVGGGPEDLVITSDDLGRDLVRAIETLVRDALGQAAPGADLTADHLLGLLGLDGDLPPLPLERLASDATALRTWLAELAATPAHLEAWFGHLAGLLGAPAPAAGTLAVELVEFGGAHLDLLAELRGGELDLGLAIIVPGSAAAIEASATLLTIPLTGTAPVRFAPRAAARVRAPGGNAPLVEQPPPPANATIRVGGISGGVSFDGTRLVPELRATDIRFEGVTYEELDLTSANAIVGAASAGVRAALLAALGDIGPARALLSLAGLAAPRTDAGTPHLLDAAGLAAGPTRAIANVHRAVLADTAGHDWGHMLGEIGQLLGLTGAVAGTGTPADPWRIELGSDGILRLDAAAWNAADATTPAGEQRLRIGLVASATSGPWSSRAICELLAFDLPATGDAAVRIVAEQRVEFALDPVPDALSGAGVSVGADAVRLVASWRPGLPLLAQARVEGLSVGADGRQVGPLTLTFPASAAAGAPLGLGGVTAADALDLLRLLIRHALQTWGGNGALALGELLGIDGSLPLIQPPDPADLTSLFTRPGEALRAHLEALATGVDADGRPYAERALTTLLALLRDQAPQAGGRPLLDVPLTGAGRYEAPWALPLLADDGERIELLAWLEPGGPPAAWAAALVERLASAADARTLLEALPRLAAYLPGLPDWLDPERDGGALSALEDWLAAGDGVVALASQLPGLPGWSETELPAGAHDDQPRAPAAIARIAAALGEWADDDGSRAVLLLGPPWKDHSAWSDLLAAVEPARPAGAHFDLRGGADPAAVTAVATHYTADLDDDGTADFTALTTQIGEAVDRIAALTGRAKVVLVAHSTAGLAARAFAAARSEVVRGIVTVGAPHGGTPPAPLTDPALADAVRAAHDLAAGALAGTPTGSALEALEAALDRSAAGAYPPGAFSPLPAGTANPVPGLALGSVAGGNLTGALAAGLGLRLSSAPAGATPTHVAFGVRAGLPLDAGVADGTVLDASVRIDAGRLRLPGAVTEPSRAAQAATVELRAHRPGGWLAGAAIGAGPRIRSADLTVRVTAGTGGAVTVTPALVLRDVALGSVARSDLDLDAPEIGPALDALAAALAPGARLDAAGLAALLQAPAAALRGSRDELLDQLETALGGALTVPLAAAGLELALDRATWSLRLRSTRDLQLGAGVGLAVDGGLRLNDLTPSLTAALDVGAVRLAFESATGALTLSAPPWLAPLVVRPLPSPAVLRDTLIPLIPRIALSSALSAVLSELLDGDARVGSLDAFLADPGAHLGDLTDLGDGAQELLRSAARALGLDDTNGLPLPGGLLLSASGGDPLRLELAGTLALDAAGDTLGLSVWLDVTADRRVTAGGELTFDVALPVAQPGPQTWGRLELTIAVSEAGPAISVTPEGAAEPITLLPNFSGFGSLVAAGTATLLPHLLQAIVDELRPAAGAPIGLLGATLAFATALGIYAEDAEGFERPERATRLAAMLQPGWFEAQVADPANLATLIGGMFGPPPLLSLPAGAGSIAAAGGTVTWTVQLPGSGSVGAAVALGSAPSVTLTVTGFDAGPLIVQSARVGFDGDLALELQLQLDAGGDLPFLTPVAELALEDGRISAALLPLGDTRRADLGLTLAPQPALAFTTDGAIALLTEWGVPLVSLLALRIADAAGVLDTELWFNGPTARTVLEGSLLVVEDSDPPALSWPFPALDALALGGLKALAEGASVALGALKVTVVDDGAGRTGLRLYGPQEVTEAVTVHFGDSEWLEDQNEGLTVWLLKRAQGPVPIALDPGLQATGVGVVLSGEGTNDLLTGPLTIGRAGALLFFKLDLLNAAGQPSVTVSDIGAAVDIQQARIDIASSDGDSFLRRLLPEELGTGFSLAVEARSGLGVRLHGGIGNTPGRIELTFPLDLDIGGVVRLEELFLSAGRSGSALEMIAAISGGAAIGPVAVAIERVGLRARFGPGGAQLGFKPPNGLGLSIATPAVRLGGFLLVDEERGRYVGAIELAIAQKFELVGIGIITTKNPDGTPGFSLLLLIAITFPVPIPLGYGFFFAGAGGLLGLNRGVDLDRLRLGLRTGAADSILFPTDIVRKIDTIVRDLEEVFPIAQGRFLVAPMAKITWSSPALITAKIGVIIEIGSPLRLALLGALRLALPDPDAAVIDLKVAFMGYLDIPAGLLGFDASIYDSYVGYADFKLSLEGDIALRISWGPQPDFVVSVGGFHPSYRPGAHLHLPPMRRMSVSLLKDNPRISLSMYFAITANSVQMGARLELRFEAGGFSLIGEAGFDVLLTIVPLHLEAHIYARLAVKAGNTELLTISLDLTLEGPTPWIARGTASFKILFFGVHVSLEVTTGEAAPVTLPEIAVIPRLLEALEDDAAWTSALGDSAGRLVHLIPPPDETLVIDAAGLLTISQKLLPLATDFSLFGTARVTDATRVSVTALRVGSAAATRRDVSEAFAPAAHRALSDQEKLSAPAFEQRPAGVQSLSGDGLVTDRVLAHRVAYETLVSDSVAEPKPEPVRATGGGPTGELFEALVPGGAAGGSPQSVARARADVVSKGLERVGYPAERYGVARIGDVMPLDAGGVVADPAVEGVLVSLTDAQARRDALIATGAFPDLQILPEAQLAA